MAKLTEPEIQDQMPTVQGWDRLGDMIVRTWQFSSARRALEFVNQAVGLFERHDHHPEIILNYRSVRIELSTHSDGGLTPRDFQLASELNGLTTDR